MPSALPHSLIRNLKRVPKQAGLWWSRATRSPGQQSLILLSMARSGSNLLRSYFNSQSEICIAPEILNPSTRRTRQAATQRDACVA